MEFGTVRLETCFSHTADYSHCANNTVVRRSDSAIHRIVIFSTFVKCLKNCETTDIDDTRSIKNI